MTRWALGFAAVAVLLGGCSRPNKVEAIGLTGQELVRPEFDPAERRELNADLRAAKRAASRSPRSEDAAIWWGRRLAYLGRYQEAIVVYTRALRRHPDSYRLRRHRGHRYITVREFDLAIDDLSEAMVLAEDDVDEMEPDGQPNELGVPRSTRKFNIAYHLGLAYYLSGEFEAALPVWARCQTIASRNDDMLVAATYWHVLTLCRLGRAEEAAALLAPINADMDVIENHDYLMLLRMMKGDVDAASVIERGMEEGGVSEPTLLYGVGAWYLCRGWPVRARAMFESVLGGGGPWSAFGYIGAEAEMAREGAGR